MFDATTSHVVKFGSPGDKLTDEDRAAAEEIAAWLRENGGDDVTLTDRSGTVGIVPLIPIVIVAVIAAGAIVEFIEFWRAKHQPEQILTYHDGKVEVQVLQDIKNGKILIFADKDTVVQIDDVKPPLDLTEVVKAAVTGGASAAADKAKEAGKDASVEKPEDSPTKKALHAIANGIG